MGGPPVEDAGPEPAEARAIPDSLRRRRRLIVLTAAVAAAVVAASLAYVFLFSNPSPVARFTATPTDLRLRVDASASSDPDGQAILAYRWDWGDGTPPVTLNGSSAVHGYALPGTYTVTLTVTDAPGGQGQASRSVTVNVLPTPTFVARQAAMTSAFDPSGTTVAPGRTVASYMWTFGDGASDTGARPVHTYAAPGRYDVTLTVTDSSGYSASTTRYVSANTTTVDILGTRFFASGCPYGAFWGLRYSTYGDLLVQSQAPCLDYFPWVLYQTNPQTNPSWLYSLYAMDARVTSNFGYSVWQPVFLPVFNASAAPAGDSFIRFNWTFDYLSLADIAYWDTTAWPVGPKYSDGFGYLVRENVTMDLQESRRIFGVVANTSAEAQAWWYANTVHGGPAGPLEVRYGDWLDQLGNGKYDIYNAFQWAYESDITDLNASVAPDGTTTVSMFLDGWGLDVLMDRWFYWGNTSYQAAVNAPYGQYAPRGWMPFETCWCENASASGDLSRGLNLTFSATSEYWWMANANPGSDGVYGTSDDQAAWNFAPSLMDYVPPLGSGQQGASQYPNSELRWYVPYLDRINAPGSYGYGQAYEYTIVPSRWNLSVGNSLTLVLPRGPVPWADPMKSSWDIANARAVYSLFTANLTLREVTPGTGYWTWDDRAKVLSVAAPPGFAWANATALPRDPAPYIEFGPAA